MLGRLFCLLGLHRFDNTLDRWRNLEVRECGKCGCHLNIHHELEDNYVSDRHTSMLWVIRYSRAMEEKMYGGRS